MAEADSGPIGREAGGGTRLKVVVATSVMLSFISFWRAAAIVLNDLGSSAFYVGGIAEQAVGPAAAWFILAVMLFSYAVRAVYMESCAMFTRGGVYRVVKEAMGSTLAKLSVSALMFDFILTGPISGVSAGQYIVGLVATTSAYVGHPLHPSQTVTNLLAACIALVVLAWFWRRNILGIHESSGDALRIMYVTTAMVVVLVVWSLVSIAINPEAHRLPPAPVPQNLSFDSTAVGWMPELAPNAFVPEPSSAATADSEPDRWALSDEIGAFMALFGIFMAFGHSVLAMSGEETLAQVNRELAHPKHRNLMRAGLVIFVYSLIFTSTVSFFAYALIPDADRLNFADNLISGISIHLAGPQTLKLLFQFFIVIVGFLMLSGAVNTAIVGSNGVLNRVSEDGVLHDWFRAPHRRYGTTYRLINLVVLLQFLTIVASRGNIFVLGEAYAFGVIWSFSFNALAMLVLRFKNRSPREWRVPLNFRLGPVEIPVGLGAVTIILFVVAGVNLVTKQVATISGIAFTAVFFGLFMASERWTARQRGAAEHVEVDQFRLEAADAISAEALHVQPGNTLCVVRDYNNLGHVRMALQTVDTDQQALLVMTAHVERGPNAGYQDMLEEEVFTSYEQLLFSRVVGMAEKEGKHVGLLVVPAADPFEAIIHTAARLESGDIIAGRSAVLAPQDQAARMGQVWDSLSERPRAPLRLRIYDATEDRMWEFFLGAHAPHLTAEEIELIHRLWLEARRALPGQELHHRDVVHLAVDRLAKELVGPERDAIIGELRRQLGAGGAPRPDASTEEASTEETSAEEASAEEDSTEDASTEETSQGEPSDPV